MQLWGKGDNSTYNSMIEVKQKMKQEIWKVRKSDKLDRRVVEMEGVIEKNR